MADSRQETRKTVVIFVYRFLGVKRKSKKIKSHIRIAPLLTAAFTVDDFRFLFIEPQPAGLKPLLNHRLHIRSLFKTMAVTNSIISISLKWDARKILFHPLVKDIMKKQIRKNRTYSTALCTMLHKPP